uniref:SLH domain-containing protein n=1 Tax=uncultured bacterium contig00045 TaxID=1181531 RepID=A0A806KDJ0_9BACT|nr:hypothetical protein [uncultured bacterium contig00045]
MNTNKAAIGRPPARAQAIALALAISLTLMLALLPLAAPMLAADPNANNKFQFGGYDWRVLDVQDSKALIISEDVLSSRLYHEYGTYESIAWADSYMRAYLNGEFFDSFDASDRARIVETYNVSTDNDWFGTSGGADTIDKVFLLSLGEVVAYFGDSGQLANGGASVGWHINDQYNDARVARETDGATTWWWLRSPGEVGNLVAVVNEKGLIDFIGNNVFSESGGVRPAMWVTFDGIAPPITRPTPTTPTTPPTEPPPTTQPTEPPPTTPPTPPPGYFEGADVWAKPNLEAAYALGLIPSEFEGVNWTAPTSRLAAAKAFTLLIRQAKGGKTLEQIAAEMGDKFDYSVGPFSDTADPDVTFLRRAGIVTGIGGNQYGLDAYSRIQMAAMIARAARNVFGRDTSGAHGFTDVPDWAAGDVGYMVEKNITTGTGPTSFSPNNELANQQTITFALRAFNAWTT